MRPGNCISAASKDYCLMQKGSDEASAAMRGLSASNFTGSFDIQISRGDAAAKKQTGGQANNVRFETP